MMKIPCKTAAAVLLITCLIGPARGSIFLTKPVYNRAEIPEVVTDETFDFAIVKVGDEIFKPFPDMDKFYFKNNGNGDMVLHIPLGFTPPTGKYTVEFHKEGGRVKYHSFYVAGRTKAESKEIFKIWTVENGGYYNRLKSDFIDTTKFHFENIPRWADHAGFNTIFFLMGQTDTTSSSVSDSEPWIKPPYESWRWFAEQMDRYKLGAFTGAFLCFGGSHGRIRDYDFSYTVDIEGEKLYRNSFVSITDEKRIKDIIDISVEADKNPHIGWIGLDYIRAGSGGFENWKEFSEIFSIRIPGGTEREKMFNLGSSIRSGKGFVREKWRYYRAYKSAQVITRVKQSIGKPLWTFTLGWEQGHSHGQDPVMFFDAGADMLLVMFYEATYGEHESMMKSWEAYLDGVTGLPLVAGQEVDVVMNDSPLPGRTGPEEMRRRFRTNISVLKKNRNFKGLFLHDMVRTFNGRILPHYSEEWLFVTGELFHSIDEALRLEVSSRDRGNTITFELKNRSSDSIILSSIDFFPRIWDDYAFGEIEVPPEGTLEIELPKRYIRKRGTRSYIAMTAKGPVSGNVFNVCYYD